MQPEPSPSHAPLSISTDELVPSPAAEVARSPRRGDIVLPDIKAEKERVMRERQERERQRQERAARHAAAMGEANRSRTARWSRDPEEMRREELDDLGRRLAESRVLDSDDEDEGGLAGLAEEESASSASSSQREEKPEERLRRGSVAANVAREMSG